MTAALVSGKVDVPDARVDVSGVKEMRSSLEVKNSCNCFQNCFPCFGRKARKIDPRSLKAQQFQEAVRTVFPGDGTMVRSPNMDGLSSPHLSVDVHIDVGDSPRDVEHAKRIQAGQI